MYELLYILVYTYWYDDTAIAPEARRLSMTFHGVVLSAIAYIENIYIDLNARTFIKYICLVHMYIVLTQWWLTEKRLHSANVDF